MRRLLIKFPSQIRISGWDFGSSARAMNQAGVKDSLMTYESVSKTQADVRKGRISTTERKSMSTKTTIKRIALVAVSALGLGVVTGVSAHAAFGITELTAEAAGALTTTSISMTQTTAEQKASRDFGKERNGPDKEKAHQAGRRYFQGEDVYGNKFLDHQKRIR